ncbi:MAG: sulfatase-like hydrolase/transferase [Planctomycetota bacterium]
MSKRPNIVLIMTDQQRRDCVGAYNPSGPRTPHIDRLAEEGVVFDRYYSSCPLCVPARSSIATGRYPHSCGATINAFGPKYRESEFHGVLNEGEVTVHDLLARAGYRIGHIGVDHVRTVPPLKSKGVFDRYISNGDYRLHLEKRGLKPYDYTPHQHPCPSEVEGEAKTVRYSAPNPGVFPYDREDFLDFFFARHAVDFVNSVAPAEPFALFCFLWAPHPPFVIPEPYYSMYPPSDIAPPANLMAPLDHKPQMHLRHLPGIIGALPDRKAWLETWAVYYGMVTMVDECIGMVLDALRSRGLMDDTILIFTSDHGEQLGCHTLFQKMVCYEESIHIPFILRAPGQTPGRREQLAGHNDILPTILDYAGIGIPDAVQGVSLRGIAEHPETPSRSEIFSEYNGNVAHRWFQRTVVTDQYKYIYNHGDIAELYDLRNDPLEMTNLAGRRETASVEADLRGRLRKWMETSGDFLLPSMNGPH